MENFENNSLENQEIITETDNDLNKKDKKEKIGKIIKYGMALLFLLLFILIILYNFTYQIFRRY